MISAVQSNPDAIKYASETVKRDRQLLVTARMLNTKQQHQTPTSRKIVLSTRFSLTPSSHSAATNFTSLFKNHDYIRMSDNGYSTFKVYAPNALNKATCDENWTDFDHPCRGTYYTCKFDHSRKVGRPTDQSCWRYSYRRQLMEAKSTGGFLLQIIEAEKWGNGIPHILGMGKESNRTWRMPLERRYFKYTDPYPRMDMKWTFRYRILNRL